MVDAHVSCLTYTYTIHQPNRDGFQVLLVHDKDTDKAAAAMDVNVGSLFDGDVEGCAHFCEHMLFLGTEAYPDEQSYSKYLNVCECSRGLGSVKCMFLDSKRLSRRCAID